MPNQPAALDDPLRGKKTGKWTKYGGSISGLVKEGIHDTWYCQLCGDEIPKEFKPFLYEIYPGDFIRIGNCCTSKVARMQTTVTVSTLIVSVRTRRD